MVATSFPLVCASASSASAIASSSHRSANLGGIAVVPASLGQVDDYSAREKDRACDIWIREHKDLISHVECC